MKIQSFKNGEHTMRTQLTKIALVAGIVLALAFTFSCHDGNRDDNLSTLAGNSSSSGGTPLSSSGKFSSSSVASSSSNLICTATDNTDTHYCSNGIMKPYGFVTYGEQTYKTVVIGTQTWMAENLNYAGTSSQVGLCYNNETENCNIYGRLYDWTTAMALPVNCNSTSCASQIGTKHKGICPTGWHIPSSDDWDILINAVGGSSTAGKHLKAKSGWNNNGNGLDTYGFSALPGGGGISGGGFYYGGNFSDWWNSSGGYSGIAYDMNETFYSSEGANWHTLGSSTLFSVRCVKD